MKNYKKLLIAVVLIGLGLGVSGCKYEYDPDQIYTKHKNACEFSIRSIENNSPMMVVGEFLYNDGVCKCKENECSVGEVCYEKFDGDIICVDYMCNDGERKCVSGKGGAYIYGCSELNWKLEKICGGENESGRCNADKTDCEKCDGNVGGCEPTETIGCEPECILVASNEFGHEYYEYKSCDKNGNPEKPKKCAFKCNDKIENGELGCVDCEKNECRDDKNLNVCDNGEFHVTTCPNGCSDGECKCNDGDVRCSGIDVQTCRDGKWITDASCSNGCSEGKCKVDCDDGDVKCDEDKYMICSGGNWNVSDECGERGCFYDENNHVMCKCNDQNLKCEGGELWKCFNGKWHARGGSKDKWPGTNINVMGMEKDCVCKTNGEVDQLTTKEVFESICNFCFEDTSAQGYYYGNNNTNGSSECRDIASGKLLSCKADFSGCGECLNGTSECVGDVPKICENGGWRDLKDDDEARACMSTMCANGAKRCDKGYIEVCNNNVWSAYEIPCLDGDASCLADGTVDSYCYGGRYGWCSEDGYKEVDCDNCRDKYTCNMQSECASPTFSCKDDNTLVKTCGGKTEDEKCNSISLKNNKCYRVDGVRDYCGVCVNGNTRCRDDKLQTCENGKWDEGTPCSSFSICEDNGDGKAKCVKEEDEKVCGYGEAKCSDDGKKLSLCEDGAWGKGRDCIKGICHKVNGREDYCEECVNEETLCDGNKLQTCVEGKWGSAKDCPAGQVCNEDGTECVKEGDGEKCNDGEVKCFYKMDDGDKIEAIYQKCENANWRDWDINKDGYTTPAQGNCILCAENPIMYGETSITPFKKKCGNGILIYEKMSLNGVFSCNKGTLLFKKCGASKCIENDTDATCMGTGNIWDEPCEKLGMYKCDKANSTSATGIGSDLLYKCEDYKWKTCDGKGETNVVMKSDCVLCKSDNLGNNVDDVGDVVGNGKYKCIDGKYYRCMLGTFVDKGNCPEEY